MSTFSVTCWPSKASGACAPAAVAACTALQRRGTEACTDVQAIRLSGSHMVLAQHAACGLQPQRGLTSHHVGWRARRAVHHRGQERPVLHLGDAKVCAHRRRAVSCGGRRAGRMGRYHESQPEAAAPKRAAWRGAPRRAGGTSRTAGGTRARQGRGRAAAGRAPQTTARPAASSSTLLDLRSRWTMAGWCWCRKAMASATSAATSSSWRRAHVRAARRADAVRHICDTDRADLRTRLGQEL
jgi:hypothetical protein